MSPELVSCSYGVRLGYGETDLCIGDTEGGFAGRNKEILEDDRTGELALWEEVDTVVPLWLSHGDLYFILALENNPRFLIVFLHPHFVKLKVYSIDF